MKTPPPEFGGCGLSGFEEVRVFKEGFTAEPPRNDSGANFHLNDSGFGPQNQGKTPWVDQSCADCPGFPVLGAGDATSRASSRSLRVCPWSSICFHGALGKFLDLLPPASLPPVQNRDAQHMFLQHKGSHADKSQSYRPKVGVTDQKSELQPGRPPESEPNRPEKGPNGV